jgi:hypothetical protein
MRGKDVNRGGNDEKKEQRHVEHVPEAEETFIDRKGGSSPHHRGMERDQVGDVRKPSTPDRSGPSQPVALTDDGTAGHAGQPLSRRAGARADRPQPSQAGQKAPGRGRAVLGKIAQLDDESFCAGEVAADQFPERIGIRDDLLYLRLAAIEPQVNLPMKIAADESAHRHDEHGRERHIAVDGAKPEVCMQQNQDRPDYSEDHVSPEPERDRTQPLPSRHALSQRVEQQQQHEACPDDAEPVSNTAFGCQVAVVLPQPRHHEDHHGNKAEGKRRDGVAKPRAIGSEVGPDGLWGGSSRHRPRSNRRIALSPPRRRMTNYTAEGRGIRHHTHSAPAAAAHHHRKRSHRTKIDAISNR